MRYTDLKIDKLILACFTEQTHEIKYVHTNVVALFFDVGQLISAFIILPILGY